MSPQARFANRAVVKGDLFANHPLKYAFEQHLLVSGAKIVENAGRSRFIICILQYLASIVAFMGTQSSGEFEKMGKDGSNFGNFGRA